MARSDTLTSLSLNRWAQVMGTPLSQFNNLQRDGVSVRTYWDQTAHDELALYISQSERWLWQGVLGASGLGFPVAPLEITERLLVEADDARWYDTNREVYTKQVQAFGVYAYTFVEADAAVAYAGDTGTVTVTVVEGTDPADLLVYYRVADGASEAGSERWRIRPVSVSVSGTTATITAPKACFVLPSVLEADTPGDYTDSGCFVAAVDVYQRSVDAELPATIAWDRQTVIGSGDSTDPVTQTGAALLIDGRRGVCRVRPATYAAGVHEYDTPDYAAIPAYLSVNYIAGHALDDGARDRMLPLLETAVVRLANVLSPDFNHWLNDLAQTKWRKDRDIDDKAPLTTDEQDNPFGFSNAARFAWRVVQTLRVPGRAV